ncbi:MAG: LLM class flavin-dependent oxidoreductase [Actinobacteria bacterium]|nr:LLM class flavin-dependent oxidoreductase [Actinomycetota bacterium]
MLVGTTLPQFNADAEAAIVAAVRAEELGLDGVFVFDHLWPIGRPDGDVLECFTLLGALAQETARIRLGPLVARVGLLPDAVLIHTLMSLHRMLGDRLIAGVGAGDRLSAAENLAYGVAYPPVADRIRAVDVVCRQLRVAGVETWIGGRSAAIRAVAAAAADALNVWAATDAEVAAEGADVPRITWGGQVDLTVMDSAALAERLRSIETAGADFAVCAPINTPWPAALEMLARARDAVH